MTTPIFEDDTANSGLLREFDQACQCDLCTDIVLQLDISKYGKYGMKLLHKWCFAALCCLERLGQKDDRIGNKIKLCLQKDPIKFKAIAMSLVTIKPRERTSGCRDETVEFLQIMIHEVIH